MLLFPVNFVILDKDYLTYIMFRRFKKELKRFGFKGILATISYLFLMGFIGNLLSKITSIGGFGYVISFLGLPYFLSAINWLSATKIVEAFRQDWLGASVYFHFLIIIDVLILTTFLHLFNQSEFKNKPLWILKKIFGK